MPVFATIFMIVTFSSIGLPGTNGFVGEFMALMGAFQSGLRWYAVFATTGVILAAVYMLWVYQRVMFGKVTNPKNENLKDLSTREIIIMIPLLVFIFWIGVYPNTFFSEMNPAMEKMLDQMGRNEVAIVEMHHPAAVEHGAEHAVEHGSEHAPSHD
jgi:NADH-quinone oxidoreductase subunit M